MLSGGPVSSRGFGQQGIDQLAEPGHRPVPSRARPDLAYARLREKVLKRDLTAAPVVGINDAMLMLEIDRFVVAQEPGNDQPE